MGVNLPLLQPKNLKSEAFLRELNSYHADLQIVVAFRMLPREVWNSTPLGTFNLHASLLPQYRGAAPINWAIINGEKETGITTFFLKHEIDTGEIIFQEREKIEDNDTVGSLYIRLMNKGANLVLRTVKSIQANDYPKISQSYEENLKKAPKIFKKDCKINWNQPPTTIIDFVRGLSPYPAAWSEFEGKNIKIFEIEKIQKCENIKSNVLAFYNDMLVVNLANCALKVIGMQIEGKKRMKTENFIRGYKNYQLN